MTTEANYYNYWGKTAPAEDGPCPFHLLPYHSLDVAASGYALLMHNSALRHRLTELSGIEEDQLVPLLSLSLALHDLGKFSSRFQNLSPNVNARLGGEQTALPYSTRHDSLGFLFILSTFEGPTGKNFSLLESKCNQYDFWDIVSPWFRAITGHHGQPPLNPQQVSFEASQHFSAQNTIDAHSFWSDLETLFKRPRFPSDLLAEYESSRRKVARLAWILAGFAVVADWLGSNRSFFPFLDTPLPLSEYFQDRAIPSAERAVSVTGLAPSTLLPQANTSSLILGSFSPSPLQKAALEVELSTGPELFIVEDMTGSGKTEAALILTHRLLQANHGRGFFFGLPTMATSSAMYDRVSALYRGMFDASSHPSLVLAHSTARLSDTFMSSVPSADALVSDYWEGEATAEAFCTSWLADSSKKALLADVGVGTIDQALLGVLPRKYQSLRLFGLLEKVTIIDEVHAFDEFTRRLICGLIEFQATYGRSVIVLSATLPSSTREELVAAFNRGVCITGPVVTPDLSYPLLTTTSISGTRFTPLSTREGLARKIDILPFHDESSVHAEIIQRSLRGECVCWIRNTVDDAISAYIALKERIDAEHLRLFHARFIFDDRDRIESEVLDSFGPRSGAFERRGRVVIATQVIEQSLDIDFDFLISDLAPIDLLLQRMGRLRRHSRAEDGSRVERDRRGAIVFGLHSPPYIEEPSHTWYSEVFKRSSFVYEDHGKLWLGARELLSRGQIELPKDARSLIEAVYGAEAPYPSGMESVRLKAEGAERARAQLGELGVLKPLRGYERGVEWGSDDIVGTRLGDLSFEIRLGVWRGTEVQPLSSAPKGQWVRSAVRAPRHKVARAAPPTSAARLKSLETASKLPLNKFSTIIPLDFAGDQFYASVCNESGRRHQLAYSRELGLYFPERQR